jgi:glutamate carboxypeptidase
MSDPRALIAFFETGLEDAVALLGRMVGFESGSEDKNDVDRLGEFLAGEFRLRGAEPTIIPVATRGNILKVEWKTGSAVPPVLVLGHLDTVWPAGTIRERPFRVTGDRAFGPGIFDMKSGILLCLLACEALRHDAKVGSDVVFLFTSDEEIGTEAGLPILQSEAQSCGAVLCLEPPLLGGNAKTFRKGVGDITIRVEGRASHAGLDHEKGANAIVELARHLMELQGHTDYDRGLTVSVGKIRGGSAVNVVPAEAEAAIDFRFATLADGEWFQQHVRDIQPHDSRCALHVSGGINRPPLERTPAVVELFETAREIARSLGMDLGEGPSGGGSDGSFTAAMGIPTLDGLGVEGANAHGINEHVFVSDIPRRAALLTLLVQSLGMRHESGCRATGGPRTS